MDEHENSAKQAQNNVLKMIKHEIPKLALEGAKVGEPSSLRNLLQNALIDSCGEGKSGAATCDILKIIKGTLQHFSENPYC